MAAEPLKCVGVNQETQTSILLNFKISRLKQPMWPVVTILVRTMGESSELSANQPYATACSLTPSVPRSLEPPVLERYNIGE